MYLPGATVDGFQAAFLLLYILESCTEHSDLAPHWCLFSSVPALSLYVFFLQDNKFNSS